MVFESILVAIIILTAILFVTSLNRPSPAQSEGAVDLGRIASDTLRILQDREEPDAAGVPQLDHWLDEIMKNNATAQSEADDFFAEVLPTGTRYVLRLDTGHGTMDLLPPNAALESQPRGGRVGSALYMPNWTVHDTMVPSETLHPGQIHDHSTWNCFTAPTGVTTGPDGVLWNNVWQENLTVVPTDIPYGIWKVHTDLACSSIDYVRVALPDGTSSDRPPYAIRLVVWFGA